MATAAISTAISRRSSSLIRLDSYHVNSYHRRNPAPAISSTNLPFVRPRSPLLSLSFGSGGITPPPKPPCGGDGRPLTDDDDDSGKDQGGLFDFLLRGWRARVAADPEFPFKVLMEEIVGVTACVLGDMASRPNFGLNELDFVFSTLVVGSIVNFLLMYLLAPTAAASAAASVTAAARGLPSYMFEPGAYSLGARAATFVSKGATFAAVGFAAGLTGTAISNGLIAFRRRIDPGFEPPNAPPPTLLNATAWALHMGFSSNFRYQALNGIEYLLARSVPGPVFKTSVVALRCGNNVIGGSTFVALAKVLGSQKAAAPPVNAAAVDSDVAATEALEDELQRDESSK